MSAPLKVLVGLVVSLLVIAIAAFLVLHHLVTKSYPVTSGTLHVRSLHSPVEIYRDQFGLPHISARDEHDLMIAAGYVQAQDRLWQMDLMRRAGEGRLAEVLGDSALPLDRLFRTLDLRDLAIRMKENLHTSSRIILENYAQGVNEFIATHAGQYPAEFDMLNYTPEPWKIEHSLLLARLLAWELNLSWWTDLTYGEIATKVPLEKFHEIIPEYADTLPVTVPGFEIKRSLGGISEVFRAGELYCRLFGLEGLSGGSNGWVVDSTKSLSGKPLLANDPHLGMPAPSRWYEMHLSAPGWNVSGATLPGVPLVLIGHNDHLAWGLTAAMIDDADFYIEKVDSLHPGMYYSPAGLRRFSEREEKIMIGKRDSVILTVRSTVHGPVLNGIHPMLSSKDQTALDSSVISMRWTGFDVSDEIHGFRGMNKAANSSEFAAAVREITVPAQSVVYADEGGTIAYWTAGRVPIRGKQNALLPLPGWTGDAEWQGYVPFEQLPHVMNPPEGFIACANQKLADRSYPYYLSSLWEPSSRIERLREILSAPVKFTAEDFKQFQQDVMSEYARAITHDILRAFDSVKVSDKAMATALSYLKNWDFRFTSSDIATTVFHVFFVHLVRNTFEDEMGPQTFEHFVFFNAIPYRVVRQLAASDSSSWWDDVRTPQRETKIDMFRKSLEDAVSELEKSMGPDMKTWRWGTLHTVTFNHPFGVRKPLDKIFNIGPFPTGGGGTSVDKTEFRMTSPYAVTVGPSLRFIVDFSRPLDAWIVNTSGESGQPFHSHYADQTPLWLNGGYVPLTMDWNEINSSNWDHLTLQP